MVKDIIRNIEIIIRKYFSSLSIKKEVRDGIYFWDFVGPEGYIFSISVNELQADIEFFIQDCELNWYYGSGNSEEALRGFDAFCVRLVEGKLKKVDYFIFSRKVKSTIADTSSDPIYYLREDVWYSLPIVKRKSMQLILPK